VGFTGFGFSGIESFSPTRFETVGESSGAFTLLIDLSYTRFLPKAFVTYWTEREYSDWTDPALVITLWSWCKTRSSVLSHKNLAFVAIKMGRRSGGCLAAAGREEGAYLNGYVTEEQRSRRPIFIATLRVVASWRFFFRRGGSRLTYQFRHARRSRLEKPPTDPATAGRKPCYLWDRTLGERK